MRRVSAAALLAASLFSVQLDAQTPPDDAGAPSGSAAGSAAGPAAGSTAGSAPLGAVYGTCIEHVPQGAKRPDLKESFPTKGLAGHALPLEVTVEHGAGEAVLPEGFRFQASGAEAEALKKSGFMLPSPDGGAPPEVKKEGPNRTRVILKLVALPKEAGRHEMVAPPMPITVSRASGEVVTLCTRPHNVLIDDPTGSTPDARPKPNPEPRRQLEDWAAMRHLVELGLVALIAAIVGAIVYRWWRRRPRPVVPPPPPRPPWEVALEALYMLRDGPMLREGRLVEYVDAVSDITRTYLGKRYGFDGLEATSREVRRAVRAVDPPLPVLLEIDRLLDEADLVKFARVVPSPDDCGELFALGEKIVKETMPQVITTVQPDAQQAAAGGAP